MRVTKNIRIGFTIVGAAAIAWGALALPASADDAPVQAADTTSSTSSTTSSSTTSSTSSTTSSTSSTSTSTTLAPTTSTTAAPTTSTTVATTPGDPDGDGAANEPVEDLFGIGITVDRDPTVAVIGDPETNGVVVALDNDGNEELRKVTLSTTRQAGNVALPSGFVSFEVVNATKPIDVLSLWPDKDAKARQLFKGTASSMTVFPTKRTNFDDGIAGFIHTISDGGAGDADKTKNGTIVDPIGPGFVNASAATTAAARPSTLARTGNDMGLPAASGFAAIAIGVILLAVAWKPTGGHYSFNR